MPTIRRQEPQNTANSVSSTNSTLLIPKVTKEMVELARQMSAEGKSRAEIERAIVQMQTQAPAAPRRRVPQAPSYAPYRPAQQQAAPAATEPEKPEETVRETEEFTSGAEIPAQPKPKKKRPTHAEASAHLAEHIRSDHIWLNNPVLVRGQFLAPAVVAASSGASAWMLCVATALLLISTRMLAALILHFTGGKGKAWIYVYCAAVVYIPVYLILYRIFGANLTALGIYLPVLAMEPAIIKRMEYKETENFSQAWKRSISNVIGIFLATMLIGILRELLGAGTVFGMQVLQSAILPMASLPAGGFILVGVLAAVWIGIARAAVKYRQEEVRRLYGKR